MCADRGPWGEDGRPKDGNTGAKPSSYLHFHVGMWEIARSKMDVIKISNTEIFVLFILVR